MKIFFTSIHGNREDNLIRVMMIVKYASRLSSKAKEKTIIRQ